MALYFDEKDHLSVLPHTDAAPEDLFNKMRGLHQSLYSRIKQHGLDLHPDPEVPGVVRIGSRTSPFPTHAVSLAYMRGTPEADTVERMMGRESSQSIRSSLHPMIELRVMEKGFVVELVITPEAWYDQQNFVGKLSVSQHRHKFYSILAHMVGPYYFGFWSGVHLHDMHLSIDRLPPARMLLEYVDTFAAGRDFFRLGWWYDHDSELLNQNKIEVDVFQRIRELYPMYDFIRWTSNNNFHNFYKKAAAHHGA